MGDDTSVIAIGATVIGLLVLSWTVMFAPHLYSIFQPSIVTYPWNGKTDDDRIGDAAAAAAAAVHSEKMHRTVIFAASYNPPHHGHLKILEYLSEKYDRVIAVVGFNPDKKYMVSPEERADLLREMLKSQNIRVSVEVVEGYIWRYAKRIGATLFVRGIRSWEKDGSDERKLQILNTWGPLLYGPLAIPIPTIYIEGDPQYNHVSSTLIRSICDSIDIRNYNSNSNQTNEEQTKNAETWLSELVPAEVTGKIAKFYGPKQQ